MIKFKKVKTENEYFSVMNIRCKVFCDEQKVDIHEELDSKDKDAIHYLLLFNHQPVGTCRVIKNHNDYLIGRMAIIKEFRNQGYGALLLQKTIKRIKKENKHANIELHAQLDKIEFYQKNGFITFGYEFMQANIPHIGMRYLK